MQSISRKRLLNIEPFVFKEVLRKEYGTLGHLRTVADPEILREISKM